jgi:DNA repair exonuclease SbcCD ATPase subunit
MPIKLNTDFSENIKYIFHVSDIHIRRSTERQKEYKQIFDKLYTIIKTRDKKETLIVITGDIFHDGYSPNAITLVKEFFGKLCDICPTILIIGNHDLACRNDYTVDYITPILKEQFTTKYHLHLLLKNELYQYNNIIFGLTTMDAIKVTPINSKVKKMNLINIGLYHGTLHGSKLDNNTLANNYKFSCKDFCDYKITMLGDIHRFQYMNKDETIAYAGSLISQNFGEDYVHGIIEWDLNDFNNIKSKFIKIDNDYQYITITVDKNGIKDSDKQLLKQNINLRVLYKDLNNDEIRNHESFLKSKYNIINYVQDTQYKDLEITFCNNKIDKIKNDSSVLNMIKEHINVNYKFDEKDSLSIEKKIKEIIKDIDMKYDNKERIFKLKSLIFDNINIYNENNKINFDLFKGAIGLLGNNAIGKSSILMALLFSIYGETHDGTPKIELINKNKKDLSTIVTFEINNIIYKIERNVSAEDGKKINENVKLYRDNILVNCKDLSNTNNEINNLVGKCDDLIRTSIILQKDNNSFFSMSPIDRLRKLCMIFNVDIFEKIVKIADSNRKSLICLIKDYGKRIYIDETDKKVGKTNNRIEKTITINKNISILEESLANLIKNDLQLNFDKISKEKIELEFKLNELQSSESLESDSEEQIIKIQHDYDLLINKMKTNSDELHNLELHITTLNNDLKQITTKLEQFNDIEEKKKEFDLQLNNKLLDLNQKKYSLQNKIINQEKILNVPYNINELIISFKTQINDLEKQINTKKELIYNIQKNIKQKEYPHTIKINHDIYLELLAKNVSMEAKFNKKDNRVYNISKELEKFNKYHNNVNCEACRNNQKLLGIKRLEEEINKIQNEKDYIETEIILNQKNMDMYFNDYDKYFDIQEELELNEKNNIIKDSEQNKLNLLEKDKELLEIKLNNYINIMDAHNNYIKIEKNNEVIRKEINNIDNEIRIASNSSYNSYSEYFDLKTKKSNIQNKIIDLEKQINNNKKNEIEYFAEKNKLSNILELNRVHLENIKVKCDLSAKLNIIKDKYTKIGSELNEYHNKIEKIKTSINENKYQLQQIEKDKEALKALDYDYYIYDQIILIINGKNFIDSLLNQIVPQFQKNINNLLSIVTNYKIEIKYAGNKSKRLDIYKSMGQHRINTNKLSGFESDILNICFRIVINQMNKNIKTNFLIMDELFTSFDNNNVNNLVRLFDYIKQHYDWFLIITHNDYIKKWLDYDLIIKHNNGISHVDNYSK